ncbi:MAG: glycosyltransferase family 4 protein [Clostridiales bacterium]|nr:glycosyltransferase family 4 protein [Clostridiales bacterium]
MKILVVCQHYWPENFRVTEICEELVQRGHQVTALVGLPNYPSGIIPEEYRHGKNRKQERNGVQIRRCFEIGRKPGKIGLAVNYVSYMVSASLKALFMKKDFDVVYSFSTSPVLMSLPASLLRKVYPKEKLMIYIMDIWPACLAAMNVKETSLLYRFMKPVSRWIYKKADRLIYSSKRFQQYLEETHGITVSDDDYMPQFADGVFDKELPPKEACGTTDLVFAGNIGKMQGVDCFIRAASLLREENLRWHIVGGGACLEECKALAEELKLTDKVIFYGQRPLEEMPGFYSKADAMLVSMVSDPLVNDTLPGKVQTYMAAAKPILGSIAGEAEYVIRDAACGLCASPENPEAFAEIVRQFLDTPLEKRSEMGVCGRSYYQQNFTRSRHMDRLEAMLTDLAK